MSKITCANWDPICNGSIILLHENDLAKGRRWYWRLNVQLVTRQYPYMYSLIFDGKHINFLNAAYYFSVIMIVEHSNLTTNLGHFQFVLSRFQHFLLVENIVWSLKLPLTGFLRRFQGKKEIFVVIFPFSVLDTDSKTIMLNNMCRTSHDVKNL